MKQSNNRLFISCQPEIRLRCKVQNDVFTKDKEYIATSEMKSDNTMYTKYVVIDDKGQSHIVTVELVLKYFIFIIEE